MGFRLTSNEMTLATLTIGAALPFAGAWGERRWRRADDREARREARAQAQEDRRLDRLARACETILDALVDIMRLCQEAQSPDLVPDAVYDHVLLISRELIFLPGEHVRERVDVCKGLVWAADVVPHDGVTALAVLRDAVREIENVVGAVARQEPCPPAPEWYAARAAAYRDLRRTTSASGFYHRT